MSYAYERTTDTSNPAGNAKITVTRVPVIGGEFSKFEELARKLVSVPKSAITDARQPKPV